MKSQFSFIDWLESHWAAPSYSGWLLFSLACCFFGAATNTMAGWLYVLSGMIFALLAISARMTVRSLRQLTLERFPLQPVSAGEDLTIQVRIANPSKHPKTLLQVWDILPENLGRPQGTAIELIPPQGNHDWSYYLPTHQRGIYPWQKVQFRTGNPLGLFWCRRTQSLPAKAIVYPQVLSLLQCPIVDAIGSEDSPKRQSDRRYQAATEGITKTLRPYRYGDSTRLIHWRTSARFDEFQVRELEIITGGQEVVIALDSSMDWPAEPFEQAVIAAASLYFYASRCQLNVKLWTAGSGLQHSPRSVLETLAAIQPGEGQIQDIPIKIPLLWLTASVSNLDWLPLYSRWLYFPAIAQPDVGVAAGYPSVSTLTSGLVIDPDQPLAQQLQKPLR